MRNLHLYPITTAEITACLTGLSEAFAEAQIIGDMRPLLLRRAAEMINAPTKNTVSAPRPRRKAAAMATASPA